MISRGEQLRAIQRVAIFKPVFSVSLVILGLAVALLEGVGLGFILPIVEIARSGGAASSEASGLLKVFVDVYATLGIPFNLGYVTAGVALVMMLRYTSSFALAWLRSILMVDFETDLKKRAFENSLEAEVKYFDEKGSDEILNAIITQAAWAGRTVLWGVRIMEQTLVSLVYFSIALFMAPMLTLLTVAVLGVVTYVIRFIIEPGIMVGNRLATANENVQKSGQAGTQGIRDVKLFGMRSELIGNFFDSIRRYRDSKIVRARNQASITNFFQLISAVTVFILIYLALTFTSLSLGGLAVFLFAMFRLAPRAGTLNDLIYKMESDLPHVIRTYDFIDEIDSEKEGKRGDRPAPDPVMKLVYEDVSFSYDGEERVLNDVTFEVDRGEYVAFVGQSGAGKTTIVSLLTRMYEPDTGSITVNSVSIDELDLDQWRSRVAVVRQDPFIFNDTLRFNLTIGSREASQEEIDRVCEIARVDEFFNELPKGYETLLGDDGVKLSGGQRERISLARALLKDADILVLDEATSNLDSNLEKEVQNSIEAMERDYITIAIAHRLSTVVNADRIYTLEDGRITETGEHDELVARDGKYAEFYSVQSQGF